MKRPALIFALVLHVSGIFGQPGNAQTLPPHFSEVASQASQHKALQARFTQIKESLLFIEPQRVTGEFAWRFPSDVRWTYNDSGSFLRVGGGSYWIGTDGASRRIDLPGGGDMIPIMLSLVTLDVEAVQSAFRITELEPPAGNLWRFRFDPKGPKGPFAHVEVDILRDGGVATQLVLTESSGDIIRISFEQVAINPVFSERTWHVPEATNE